MCILALESLSTKLDSMPHKDQSASLCPGKMPDKIQNASSYLIVRYLHSPANRLLVNAIPEPPFLQP